MTSNDFTQAIGSTLKTFDGFRGVYRTWLVTGYQILPVWQGGVREERMVELVRLVKEEAI